MKAIDTLTDEHRVIEQGLNVLENVTRRVADGQTIASQKVEELLDFFSVYADKSHHGKEERVLVPQMEDRCGGRYLCPHHDLLDRMDREHKIGRELIARMRAASHNMQAEPVARQEWVEGSRQYIDMLRGHIRMEEDDLFPEMENLLWEYDRSLTERYERQTGEEVGEGISEKHHRAMEELAKEFMAPTS